MPLATTRICPHLISSGKTPARENGAGICASFGNGSRDRNPELAGLSARLFVDIEAADQIASVPHMAGHQTAHEAKANPGNRSHRFLLIVRSASSPGRPHRRSDNLDRVESRSARESPQATA